MSHDVSHSKLAERLDYIEAHADAGGTGSPANLQELVGIARDLLSENETLRQGAALLDRAQVVRFIVIDKDSAVCVGGRFDAWLMFKHPDGQWVTLRKLEAEVPQPLLHTAEQLNTLQRPEGET